MANNKLVINGEKTHLVIMGTKLSSVKRSLVNLNAGQSVIVPSPSEKLLGLCVNENMKFHEHLLFGDNSLVKILSSKVNAISKLSRYTSFKTRLKIANAIFNSNLIYMIAIWGGTEKFIMNILQVIQNRAARCITGLGVYAETSKLLQQCNWLSVQQLAVYHSVLQVYKAKKNNLPEYISSNISRQFPYKTRASSNNDIRLMQGGCYNVTAQSFMVRGIKLWKNIPLKIWQITEVKAFKLQLKSWVKQHVDVV